MGQHCLNKYPKAFIGVINQHMGDGSDNLTILNDGTATEPLYNSSGDF